MGVTLRYPYEVRDEQNYFDEIPEEKLPKEMLELAAHIVDQKRGKFQPDAFEDRYEAALKDLLERKQKGLKIERPKERAPANVVNLMDALRQSIGAERRTASPRKAATSRRGTPKGRRAAGARQKKAS